MQKYLKVNIIATIKIAYQFKKVTYYTIQLEDNIVILFGGAEKTANTPQECDRVRPHFLLANRLTPVIDQAIRDGDIRIDEEANELIFDEDLILGL